MRLEKSVLSHPVTGLASASLCGVEALLMARGSDMDIYTLDGGGPALSTTTKIFQFNTVMGIKVVQSRCADATVLHAPLVLLYGDKSLCVLEVERAQSCTQGIGSTLRAKDPLLLWEHQLEDLVLDCSLLYCDERNYIAIGYAHNFVDVYDLDALIAAEGGFNERHRAYRIKPLENFVLFSLSFSNEAYDFDSSNNENSGWVTVASGTAFGKLLVWRFNHHSRRAALLHSLTQHEGVIFNLRFDAPHRGGESTRLSSVSDDRTVRVWDLLSGEQLFVGWGHVSRVWDVVFLRRYCHRTNSCSYEVGLGSGSANETMDLVATCSEDGSVRIWDVQAQRCLCILRGHSCDIWRLARSASGGYLFAGANNGCVKAYSVAQGIALCPFEPRFETIQFPSPSSSGSSGGVSRGGHASRRADCVSFMKFSVCGGSAVVGLADGRVWLVSLLPPSSSSSSSSSGHTWTLLAQAPAAIVSGDSFFAPQRCKVTVCLSDGRAMLISADNPSSSPSLNSDGGVASHITWRAHALRTINTLLLPHSHVLSASTKGECALWLDAERDGEPPLLVARCSTAKEVIATCAALFKQGGGVSWLLLGDCKGSVTCVQLKERLCSHCLVDDPATTTTTTTSSSSSSSSHENCDSSQYFVKSTQYLKHPHGTEAVTVLRVLSARCFISLGHDGSACVFRRGGGAGESFMLCSRLPLLPVRSPDTLLVYPPLPEGEGEGEEGGALLSSQERSLLVGGYAGRQYVVYDVLRQQELLRVNGGSWKRPHACALSAASEGSTPQASFLCAAPCESSGGTLLLRAAHSGSGGAQPQALSALQFGYRSLGKVAYAAALMRIGGEVCAAVGGEEGRVSLLRIASTQDQDQDQGQPLSSSRLQPLFEASMPGNVCIRSICFCSGEGHTLLLAAGGRLTYSLWAAYDDSGDRSAAAAVNSQFVSVGSGTTMQGATQDHRFLAAALLPLLAAPEDTYLVILCDSRGVVTLASKRVGSGLHSSCSALLPIDEFVANSSASPVLCCSATRLSYSGGGGVLGCFGDTSGGVCAWALSEDAAGARPSTPLFSVSAHSMGCNSLSVYSFEESLDSWCFLIASGGDDQSICVAGGLLSLKGGVLSAELRLAQRINGCAGSAVNGIKLLPPSGPRPELLALSAGYDRRLAVWALSGALEQARHGDVLLSCTSGDSPCAVALEPEAVSLREGLLLRYAAGSLIDLGDVGALDVLPSREGAHALAAGEGLQLFSLLLDEKALMCTIGN